MIFGLTFEVQHTPNDGGRANCSACHAGCFPQTCHAASAPRSAVAHLWRSAYPAHAARSATIQPPQRIGSGHLRMGRHRANLSRCVEFPSGGHCGIKQSHALEPRIPGLAAGATHHWLAESDMRITPEECRTSALLQIRLCGLGLLVVPFVGFPSGSYSIGLSRRIAELVVRRIDSFAVINAKKDKMNTPRQLSLYGLSSEIDRPSEAERRTASDAWAPSLRPAHTTRRSRSLLSTAFPGRLRARHAVCLGFLWLERAFCAQKNNRPITLNEAH